MNRFIKKALVAASIVLGAFAAHAQQWPSRPITIVVPFPPGGFNDTLARTLSSELPKVLGQPVIVENKPGGNSVIGTEFVSKAAPDGYTLFIGATPMAVLQHLYKTSFDAKKDFSAITIGGITQNVLVARPSLKANNVKELLALAKAEPGKLNYASTGNGSSNHLAFELFKTMSGTNITHIPYKGSGPAVVELVSERVDVMFNLIPNVMEQVKAGRLKVLAISGEQRSPLAPEIPTVSESGLPGFGFSVWIGVLAPAGTPKPIVDRLNTEITKIVTSPEVKERFAKQGVEVAPTTPDKFNAFLRQEVDRWGKVVRDAGIKAD
jgi:tripartite-type tricarboxylate transporter receptor subunit TctC